MKKYPSLPRSICKAIRREKAGIRKTMTDPMVQAERIVAVYAKFGIKKEK